MEWNIQTIWRTKTKVEVEKKLRMPKWAESADSNAIVILMGTVSEFLKSIELENQKNCKLK